jgi:hypothetical protein
MKEFKLCLRTKVVQVSANESDNFTDINAEEVVLTYFDILVMSQLRQRINHKLFKANLPK